MSGKNKEWVLVKESNFSKLKGKTITKIVGLKPGSYDVKFYCSDGTRYQMYPDDDSFLYGNACWTDITDVNGDVESLIGNEILIAEERRSEKKGGHMGGNRWDDPEVWTFYTLATVKGYVDIRWYGTHNGYYSAEVCFWEMEKDVDYVDPEKFNLANYQEWFNSQYFDNGYSTDYRLDDGMFPEDGEYGMYQVGYEIGQYVYEEGIDIRHNAELLNKYGNHTIECRKSSFNTPVNLLPFKEEYIPVFEKLAVDFTGI